MKLTHIAMSLLLSLTTFQASASPRKKPKDVLNPRRHWVDSVYNSMTREERIGQLFMVAAYSGGKNYNEEEVTKLIDSQHVGGLIFMQGTPVKQAILTNNYQRRTKVPLLIGMDAEWGVGMRLDSVMKFPRQMMLGATHDTSLVYRVGAAIAAQCKRLGVHINFAPDVDVNNNAANPVINSRSFGEVKDWVARLAIALMNGMQNNGIIACAKHFPGHGDTNTDSHKDLPLITKTFPQIDSLELYPFRKMIGNGVLSVMVGHLQIPSIDTSAHLPTSLSKPAITGLLKEKLGYNGVTITDGMGMQGIAKYYTAVDANLMAFAAGNDIILFPTEVPASILKIKNALDSGLVPEAMLEASVRRILGLKYYAGLHKEWKDIDTLNMLRDLNRDVNGLKEAAAKGAITLVNDDNQVIKKLNDNMSVTYIGINADKTTPLYETLIEKYPAMKAQWLPKNGSEKACKNLLAGISYYDAVIVGVHNVNFSPGANYGLSEEALNFLEDAAKRKNVMIVLMGNAYALQYMCGAASAVVAYEADSIAEVVAGKMLLKKIPFRGQLPVTVCVGGKSIVPVATKPAAVTSAMQKGQPSPKTFDLAPTLLPADAGVVDATALDKLGLFLNRCVADGVFPGCRVLAAKDGKVFFDRAVGYFTYEKDQPVDTNTLYDMASCTKVLATNISVMRLYEEGKISLDKTLGDYLPQTRGTNKAGLTIRDILLHQAGLKSWIPFYKETLTDKGKPQKNIYRKKAGDRYNVHVSANLYMCNDYRDTIWARILASPLDNVGKSVYSDLDFIFLASVVEKITGKTIDAYAAEQFYQPLGLKRITYNPLNQFAFGQIAPTELDMTFRQEQVQGYVHDPCAAMLGGIAGHAGLFASAHDVAVIFQMLLNKGTYGGKTYFKPETVELFTAYNSKLNHRGLGFDKPATGPDDGGPCGARCSGKTFGHQGFTGTCAWADPATGIVFVFLSNRVYPTADNNLINKQNVRTLAQDYVYEALGIPVNHGREQVYKEQVR